MWQQQKEWDKWRNKSHKQITKAPQWRGEKMNRFQPFSICLQEVMLENVKHNLGRKYELYATIPSCQRSKGWAAVEINKRNSTQKTKYNNNPPGGSSVGLPGGKKKNDNMCCVWFVGCVVFCDVCGVGCDMLCGVYCVVCFLGMTCWVCYVVWCVVWCVGCGVWCGVWCVLGWFCCVVCVYCGAWSGLCWVVCIV